MTIEVRFGAYGTQGTSSTIVVADDGASSGGYDRLQIAMLSLFVGSAVTNPASVTISPTGTWVELDRRIQAPSLPGRSNNMFWWWGYRVVPSGSGSADTFTVSGRGSGAAASSQMLRTSFTYRNVLSTPAPICSPVDATTTVATSLPTSKPVTLNVTSTAVGAVYAQEDSGDAAVSLPDNHPSLSTAGWVALPPASAGAQSRIWTPNNHWFASSHILFVIRESPDPVLDAWGYNLSFGSRGSGL